MLLDPPTMFFALVASTAGAALLLLWCYWLNKAERSLFWMGTAFLLAAVGILLLAGRNQVPDWLSIDVGVAILCLGTGMTYSVARVFNGKSPQLWVPAAGSVVWLIACRFPAFYESFTYRASLGTLLIGGFALVTAWEMLLRDGLKNRVPVAIVLAAHGAIVLMRIPLVLLGDEGGTTAFDTSWFGPIALECAVFVQVISFLMVSLTKERLEATLRSAALTDPLTGLANRRAFFERANAIVRHDARYSRPTAMIVFDLDRFKEINDRHGHPVGDAVLKAFAGAASTSLRAGDFIGRLGGEEFAAVLPDTSEARAAIAAKRIMEAFTLAVGRLAGTPLTSTTSAGVSASLESSHSVEALLAAADQALYHAKRLGGAQLTSAGTLSQPEVIAA